MRTCNVTHSNRTFYALSSKLKYVFCLLLNRARHTLHSIGHCIVLINFVFDMLSFRLKIQSLSLLCSSCENSRPLAEAKCHTVTVWKMIVDECYGLTIVGRIVNMVYDYGFTIL